MKILVVGAGFAGSVIAERLARAGNSVTLIDKRDHIAGNAFDERDDGNVLVHRYGPHIFHTNSQVVFDYLSYFTDWIPYEHRVKAVVDNKMFPFPINRTTLNLLYNLNLGEADAADFFEKVREPRDIIRTSEDLVLNSVGKDLCDKFFRNYTRKQWGLELSELSAGVAGRIPVRTNTDDRYFTDQYQYMPKDGYTVMFQRLLSHRNIAVELGVDFLTDRNRFDADLIVYTGSLDSYFDNRLGKLPYRSIRFEHKHTKQTDQMQPVGTINFPNDYELTRVTEFKHLTSQQCKGTSFVCEYPCSEGDPFYPIPTVANEALAVQYRALAAAEGNVIFVGRLAQYKYFNMDQVVAASLKIAETID